MRQLTRLSRRRFGQGLSASVALTDLPRPAAAHDGPHTFEVRVSGFAFVPQRVEIAVGDTVVWINEDIAPHTATARDRSWETDALDAEASARVVFETPGEFEYFCVFHPHMTGTVFVRPKRAG
ncbi:MAG: cupredoxin family copper-binding protein [Pseudomonadota bacterium]